MPFQPTKDAVSPDSPKRVVVTDDQGQLLDGAVRGMVWSTASLAWIRGQQSLLSTDNLTVTSTITGAPTVRVGFMPSLNALVAFAAIPTVNPGLVISTFQNRSDTYTGATFGVAVNVTTAPLSRFAVQVKGTGGVPTSWDVRCEGSLDGTNFSSILTHTNTTGDGEVLWSAANQSASFYLRSRCAGLVLGVSATDIVVRILGVP